jgi:hypothetical protein
MRVERNSDRDSWLIAWAMTLTLHAVAILLFRSLPPPMTPQTIQRIEPIRLVFAKTGPGARKPEAPHFFSELPHDRADAAPKKAEFLSNVTSRARDLVPGGDDGMPRMEGEGDAPLVKLEPGGGASRPATSSLALDPAEPASPRAAESPQRRDPAKEQTAATGATAAPNPTQSATAGAVADVTPHDAAGANGNSDIYQPEMANPGGNAGLAGDVSLNTIAWEYAPWLERFGRLLMHRWIPPPAYSFGILKEGGWAVIEVEYSRSGAMLRLDVLEEHGHPSLSQAAQSALRSVAPVERLPADFPEPTLILRIRMIYPKIRPR